IDITQAGSAAANFLVFTTIGQRLQPDTTKSTPTFTYTNTVSDHYTVANQSFLINIGSSMDPSTATVSPTVIYSGSTAGNTAIDLGNQALNFRNFANQVSSIPGNIIDSPGLNVQGAFTKQAGTLVDGTGVLILSGTNTYDGTTTVGAGIVRVASDTALGSLA